MRGTRDHCVQHDQADRKIIDNILDKTAILWQRGKIAPHDIPAIMVARYEKHRHMGQHFQTMFEFLIIALALFVLIKAINRLKRPSPATPVPPTKTEALLQEIRDQLARR